MKISKFTIITSMLVIVIPLTYYSVSILGNNAGRKSLAIVDINADITKEIKLLKSEISALKIIKFELNNLKQEIALLKNKKGVTNVQTQVQDNAIKNTIVHQDETETAEMNPIEMGKKQEDQRTKELDLVNNAFLAETSDPQWAPEATTLVSSFFESDAGAKIKLSDLECRKTLCKVEISKPDSAEANDNLMLNFPMHVSKALSQSSSYYTQNEDGTTRVTMYLVRNGYELPTNF